MMGEDLRERLKEVEADQFRFHKYNLQMIRNAMQLRAQGNSYPAVAKKLGIADTSGSTVRRWYKRYSNDDDFWRAVNEFEATV